MKRIILATLFAIGGMLMATSDTDCPEFKAVHTHGIRDGNSTSPMVLTSLYFNGEPYYTHGLCETEMCCETANDFLRFDSDVDKGLEAKVREFFDTATKEVEKYATIFKGIEDLDIELFRNKYLQVYFERNCRVVQKHRQSE